MPHTHAEDRRRVLPADVLGRQPLAARIARLIAGYRGRESLVIGIEGPWGAGKTSFTSLVLAELGAVSGAIVVPFNPWSVADEQALLTEMSAAVRAALVRASDSAAPSPALTHAARLRATALRALSISVRASARLRTAFAGGTRGAQDAEQARAEIHSSLANVSTPVLLVVDDIDRLGAEQMRLLMKVVRLGASLPNMVFLLVYDRARVTADLGDAGRPGEELLRTIVDFAIGLPEPTPQELSAELEARLAQTLESVHGTGAGTVQRDERWTGLVHGRLPVLFRSMADIVAFVRSLRLGWQAVDARVLDAIDFVGIEALRFLAPGLYSAIAANRTLFTGAGREIHVTEDEAAGEREALYEQVLRTAPAALRPALHGLCAFLFPAIARRNLKAGHEDEWRRDRRISSEKSFALYFQLGIAQPVVSDTEVLLLRRRLGNVDAATEFLRDYLIDGKLAGLLSRTVAQAPLLGEAGASGLLQALWRLEQQIESHGSISHASYLRSVGVELAVAALRAIEPQARAAFLERAIGRTNAVLQPVALISALALDANAGAWREGVPLLAADEIERLQRAMLASRRMAA